jgi:hypothetical protein
MNPEALAERVLICGDKAWRNLQLVLDELSKVQQERGVEEVVVEGDIIGAAELGRQAAVRLGIPVTSYPLNWRKYGLRATSVRHAQMLKEGKPPLGLAFHNYIENSKGTKDMVAVARAAGVPVHIITERDK